MEYNDYRTLHAQMYPSLVPKWEDYEHRTKFPKWLPPLILIMFVCISTLSGVHTIPTVRASIPDDAMFAPWVRDLVAYGAFVAYELSIFFTAYAMIYNSSIWTWLVMIVSSAVMIASNVYQTSHAMGQEEGVMVVSYIVGFGTPLLAIFSGKLYVWIEKGNKLTIVQAKEDFKQAEIAYDERVFEDFNVFLRREEKKQKPQPVSLPIEKPRPAQLPAPVEVPETVSAKMDREALKEHLTANPSDMSMTVREMEKHFGVSKSVAAKVKQELNER